MWDGKFEAELHKLSGGCSDSDAPIRWKVRRYQPECDVIGRHFYQHVVAKTPTAGNLLSQEWMGLVGARESLQREGQVMRAAFLVNIDSLVVMTRHDEHELWHCHYRSLGAARQMNQAAATVPNSPADLSLRVACDNAFCLVRQPQAREHGGSIPIGKTICAAATRRFPVQELSRRRRCRCPRSIHPRALDPRALDPRALDPHVLDSVGSSGDSAQLYSCMHLLAGTRPGQRGSVGLWPVLRTANCGSIVRVTWRRALLAFSSSTLHTIFHSSEL
jgi:hypothetical protein